MSEFPLENLPEEVIFHIFGYFKLKDLMNCGQLSTQIRRIALDQKLWQRVDVNNKKVSTNFLEMILGKGCKFLDISLCETLEETLNFEGRSELRHLDVSNYFPKKQVIEKILRSCHDLEKLAMRNLTLWPNVICDFFKINGPTLQILNLKYCEGSNPHIHRNLDFETIQIITKECINLKEVDFSGTIRSFDNWTIKHLVNNITTNLEKISLANIEHLGDDDVHILAQRFYELDSTEHSCVLCSTYFKKGSL